MRTSSNEVEEFGPTTNELAASLGVVSQSIRAQLCRTGSYYGLVPKRLPNDRLIWPTDSKERLLNAPPVERKRPTPVRKAA